MLADVKDETLGARLSDVRAKGLVTVMADTIADVQKRQIVTHWVMLTQKRLSTRWLAYNKRCKPTNFFLDTRVMGVQP